MESLYGKYIKERLDHGIVETEKGFMTYSFVKDACYINDVFILPEFRRSSECTDLGKKVEEIAKQKGFNKLYGSVVPSTNNSTLNLLALLKNGWTLDSSADNFILVKKEI